MRTNTKLIPENTPKSIKQRFVSKRCSTGQLSLVLLIVLLNACTDKPDSSAPDASSIQQQNNASDTSSSSPATANRETAEEPLTIAILEKRGALKLTNHEIQNLIVDHSIVFQQIGTGEYFEAIFLKNGLRLLTNIDAGSLEGEVLQDEYMVKNDKLQTEFKGNPITTNIYLLNQRYFAAVDSDNGIVNYEIRDIQKAPLTIQVLKSQGARELSTDEIKQLLVGKTVLIKDLMSGDVYQGTYGENGVRALSYINPLENAISPEKQRTEDTYRIADSQLFSSVDGNEIATRLFKLEQHYYGALNIDDGAVNFEFLPHQ